MTGLDVLIARQGFRTPGTSGAAVASVVVSGATSVVEGGATPLTATVRDVSSNVLADRLVTWSSSVPSVATVDSDGVVRGVSAGSTVITATCEGVPSDGYSFVVDAAVTPVVTTVSVTPTSANVTVSTTRQLTATVKDQNGNVMTGQTVTWSSGSPSVASVDANGLVTAGASAGQAIITAAVGAVSGTSTINVVVSTVTITPVVAPKELSVPSMGVIRLDVQLARVQANGTLSAKLVDAYEDMSLHTISVSSDNEAVATVAVEGDPNIPNSTVIVAAHAPGVATITVVYDGGTYTKSSVVTVDDTAPATAPAGLAEDSVSGLNVSAHWSPWTDTDGDFDNFRAFYRSDGADPTTADPAVILSYLSNATSGVIRLGAPSTTYRVAIAAVDQAGNVGPLSNVISVTTGAREASHEPVDYTEIFADDGTTLPPSEAADWRLALVADPESPSGSAVEWRWWNANQDANTNWDDPPGFAGHSYAKQDNGPFGNSVVSEAYFRLVMKHNVDWIHHPSGDKLSYFGQSSMSSAMCPILYNDVGTYLPPLRVGYLSQMVNRGSFKSSTSTTADYPIYPGPYHVYEFQLIQQSGATDPNTGQYLADGTLRYWIDGVLVVEKTNVQWVTTGVRGFKKFEWGPFWGGVDHDNGGTFPTKYARVYKHTLARFLPVNAYDWVRFAEFHMSGKL